MFTAIIQRLNLEDLFLIILYMLDKLFANLRHNVLFYLHFHYKGLLHYNIIQMNPIQHLIMVNKCSNYFKNNTTENGQRHN
jgi:hypothetical protein